jgi:uncharacterized protein
MPARPPGILLLCGYLILALLTGAVFAPLLFKLGQWYVQMVHSFHHENSPVIGWLAEKCERADFGRYFNRAMLVSALVWLWPFSKWAGVKREDLGLQKNVFRWQDAMIGFMLASGLLLLMGFYFVNVGRFTARPGVSISSIVGTALFAAVSVGLIEEFFFRGALMGLLLRTLRPWAALLFLSFFFSIVHLLQPPAAAHVPNESVEMGSGFWVVGQIFAKFGDADFLIAEGSTLFVVGLILGFARLRTHSLWLSIGLHAGWVFGIKFFSGLTRTPKKVSPEAYLPWIGGDLKIGVTPLIVLTVTGMLVIAWLALRQMAIASLPKSKRA